MDRNLIDIYKNNGFIEFEDLFSDEQINHWNDVLDRFYLEKDKKVTLDLLELGKPGFEIVKEFLK